MTAKKTAKRALKTRANSAARRGRPKLPDEVREAIVALRTSRPGITVAELARATGTSQGSVATILRGLPGLAAGSEAVPPIATPAESFVRGPEGDAGLVESYERLSRQLLLDADQARVKGDMRLASQVTTQGVSALQKLFELRPPAHTDPSADPSNLLAREEVLRRVEALVAREESGRVALAELGGAIGAARGR